MGEKVKITAEVPFCELYTENGAFCAACIKGKILELDGQKLKCTTNITDCNNGGVKVYLAMARSPICLR